MEHLDGYVPSFGRKDLYRICLITGKSIIHYNDQQIRIAGNYLFFGNINTPYAWEIESGEQLGYSCLFTYDYLLGADHGQSLKDFSPFNAANIPLYALTSENQVSSATFIFDRLMEINSIDYPHRRDMIRSLINLLMHEALLIRPLATYRTHRIEPGRSSQQLSTRFLNLLDSQFPVESKRLGISMTTVADFAGKLGIHPNYLNRAVKKDTGKTVLRLINERIITEAKVLLEQTDWSISEISFCLGFEYHSYFDNVFRKVTGCSPKAYREGREPVQHSP
ncbi:hypothetical protein CKK33_01855 [Mucilaginibacter sp. MD40]|uniref:helix-turn-helix domain-containing protein n=1 Tax=Mucilaginibacter sp. MD40 TaxID=2029590 RepID=UPI000BACCB16|nr:AraC family transcriptional regulator [Mucilaginibacter sp. MD40]PAW92302.1 hypothetical protein CKK33_01855 [Mucilaginibacter sp. MD40]